MDSRSEFDARSAGQCYDHYMGRWSREVATAFVHWIEPPPGADWLEIGCGTGALTAAILSEGEPGSIISVDRSLEFLEHARRAVSDPRVGFAVAGAEKLPVSDASVDAVVSALVLNFIPNRVAALREKCRVLRPGGRLGFYVWDYPGGGIGFIDAFREAAESLDPAAEKLDEARRFPFCTRHGLLALCREAGIEDAEVGAIDVETEFADFEAFWHPFTLGAGLAPGYCRSLPDERRACLRQILEDRLGRDGPIRFTARAWAVRARAQFRWMGRPN